MRRMFPPPGQPRSHDPRGMRIGELAARSGIPAGSIRFYERQGLLEPPARDDGNNYREYDEHAVARLQSLRQLQELGFSIREMAELIALSGSRTGHKGMRSAVEGKRVEVALEVERATRALATLDRALAACTKHADRAAADCPISKLVS